MLMADMIFGESSSGLSDEHTVRQSPSTASIIYNSPASTCKKTQRLNHSCDSVSKKKREKATGGGMRQFSFLVCKKVESKGRTTYNEVTDEILTELAMAHCNSSPSLHEFEEKNIRRRVYDVLNVLVALDIIARDRKEIWWKGLCNTYVSNTEKIKELRAKQMTTIAKKAAYLKDIEEQIAGIEYLMQRNHRLLQSGNVPSRWVPLPFILVQTSPQATVEIEMSEDTQLVYFDFDRTPFLLHDDSHVLKLMNRYPLLDGRQSISQTSSNHFSSGSDDRSCGTN